VLEEGGGFVECRREEVAEVEAGQQDGGLV
jgi:hypothetical protein